MSPIGEPELHYLLLAAKYWMKTLDTFDERTGIGVTGPSAYEALVATLSTGGANTPESK